VQERNDLSLRGRATVGEVAHGERDGLCNGR
jgi:hypothetical protein